MKARASCLDLGICAWIVDFADELLTEQTRTQHLGGMSAFAVAMI